MPLSLDLNCCSFKTPQYVWLAAYQNAHTGLLVTYKILLLYLIIRYKICRNNHSGITYSLKLAKYLAFSTFILALHVLLYTETDSDIWHYFCRLWSRFQFFIGARLNLYQACYCLGAARRWQSFIIATQRGTMFTIRSVLSLSSTAFRHTQSRGVTKTAHVISGRSRVHIPFPVCNLQINLLQMYLPQCRTCTIVVKCSEGNCHAFHTVLLSEICFVWQVP